MVKAVWKNKELAASSRTVIVDRKHYFPVEDVNMDFLKPNNHHTVCPWKGEASYYNVVVDGSVNENAAWYYPNPSEKAKHFKSYISFSYVHGIDTIEMKE